VSALTGWSFVDEVSVGGVPTTTKAQAGTERAKSTARATPRRKETR
jgi:hypothetical protein